MISAAGRRTSVALLVSIAALSLVSCRGAGSDHGDRAVVQLAPLDQLSTAIQQASVVVRDAYRFALANPSLLGEIPCYCGCGAMGHTSNAACYLTPDSRDGAPLFDEHALGCSICVDITHDVMRLMRQGTPLAEIRAYVDTTYGRFGPSNIPAAPGGGGS